MIQWEPIPGNGFKITIDEDFQKLNNIDGGYFAKINCVEFLGLNSLLAKKWYLYHLGRTNLLSTRNEDTRETNFCAESLEHISKKFGIELTKHYNVAELTKRHQVALEELNEDLTRLIILGYEDKGIRNRMLGWGEFKAKNIDAQNILNKDLDERFDIIKSMKTDEKNKRKKS